MPQQRMEDAGYFFQSDCDRSTFFRRFHILLLGSVAGKTLGK